MEDIKEVVESLNPDERAILPFLKESLKDIIEHSELDETKVMRALQYLSNKEIVKLSVVKKKLVDLGDNGVIYLKNGLPERRLLNLLVEKHILDLDEAKKTSKLSENEFKAALGVLKKKAMIDLQRGKIMLKAKKQEIVRKSMEEQFLETCPLEFDKLKPEQKAAYNSLRNRKNIVELIDEKKVKIKITDLGKQILTQDLSKLSSMIETLTPEMLRNDSWKGKKFRRYDIKSRVPEISGGKKHFVNQAREHARKIWTDLGFKEMTGNITQTGFWNFDALFTAQDHPVREMHDTFYIKDMQGRLPADKTLIKAVRQAHEQGTPDSKGWQYTWNEEIPKKIVLRTHTTCLSAQTLYQLSKLKDKKGKFFAIGKNFRNETVDWSHGFEFNQTEGIVVDKDANFRHLLGYLKQFFKKMGFEQIRFAPAYFPYTEPSVEITAYHPEKKVWLELGGAGIFRPEVVIPLLGEYIPVLAWGPGFDRIMMDYYEIKDMRELYENNLTKLRKIKPWLK
ncbi:MAG: phenylalanine--tRNA ligase subunit alpha [Candidatus Thorarchaeota archaeon]|jgi:phenylalanyl-tRNA synthetase alpha chain